ncbi:MAG: S-adenosylmethionine decarboxylase [Vampirovibrionales bacterium]|nr:S-adenosylmethionine decarboxylase [Vampirovibrionales bacterium]
MKDLAPAITRQRLLIEATYAINVSKKEVAEYLFGLAKSLNLRVYGEPIIHSPSGEGKEVNQGFDAFIPLIDSGIALYIWSNENFLSCVLYTCKSFSVEKACQYTQEFFKTSQLEFKSF